MHCLQLVGTVGADNSAHTQGMCHSQCSLQDVRSNGYILDNSLTLHIVCDKVHVLQALFTLTNCVKSKDKGMRLARTLTYVAMHSPTMAPLTVIQQDWNVYTS